MKLNYHKITVKFLKLLTKSYNRDRIRWPDGDSMSDMADADFLEGLVIVRVLVTRDLTAAVDIIADQDTELREDLGQMLAVAIGKKAYKQYMEPKGWCSWKLLMC